MSKFFRTFFRSLGRRHRAVGSVPPLQAAKPALGGADRAPFDFVSAAERVGPSVLDEKLRQAREFLGERWVLHPVHAPRQRRARFADIRREEIYALARLAPFSRTGEQLR